jgi:hypothetical protein
MAPKKFAISSCVGAWSSMFGLLPPFNAEGNEYADSVRASEGTIEDARGVDAYRSWRRVLPSEITGTVA